MKKLAVLMLALGAMLSGCVVYDGPDQDRGHHRGDRDRDRNRTTDRMERDHDADGAANRQDRRPDDSHRY